MDAISDNLTPPYVAVIFTARHAEGTPSQASQAALRLGELAINQSGFLGIDTSFDESGHEVTASYWQDLAAVESWQQAEAQREANGQGGDTAWLTQYDIRVCHIQDPSDFQADQR